MKTIKNLIIILLMSGIFIQCKKDNEKEDDNLAASISNALAEDIFDDVYNQVNSGIESQEKGGDFNFSGCPVIHFYFSNPSDMDTMIIDFGNENCLDSLTGKTRRGKINVYVDGRYVDSGSVSTVFLEDYYVNDHHVQGTKTISNNGFNADGHIEYAIEVMDASITMSNGVIEWTSQRTRKWVEGFDTGWPWIFDDVYLISGSANGTAYNGKTYTVDISTPLRIQIGCRWIVSGIIELKPEGLPARILNYGDGSCDNKATVTIEDRVYNITLN